MFIIFEIGAIIFSVTMHRSRPQSVFAFGKEEEEANDHHVEASHLLPSGIFTIEALRYPKFFLGRFVGIKSRLERSAGGSEISWCMPRAAP